MDVKEAVADAVEQSPDKPKRDRLQEYMDVIAKYEKTFKPWEGRVSKILKRYRDEERSSGDRQAKFNILWSNVQTLVPATFARLPQPDVSRRFRDQDPVGRVAALLLERGLEFEVQHYPDYRDTMTQCVHDRFLGGRGTAWIRYEPHFKDAEALQITEDSTAHEPEEELDYECAPVDYVHWKDFGHEVARTWEEVPKVWRKVYMGEAGAIERFGEEKAAKLSYDATPQDLKKDRGGEEIKKQACVIELWDKDEGKAVWFTKGAKEFLDERDDPLKLQQFFPCPKPLFATLTNDTLIPVPDFTLYQDQANELDILSDRIDGLAKMLQLKGVYDASADSSLARLFIEGDNGTLLPVKNWAVFAEKNGLKGQIDVYDLTPIVKALEAAYLAMDQIKNQVYEIMGISDIVRGSSDPNETLGAQELKGQYASMRLRAMQADVARFATDVLQLKAQVMCGKFNPQTLVAISAAEQLSETDKQAVPQALALLVGEERMQDPAAEGPNPLRAFRVEVNADSMIQMNEAQDKADRLEFLVSIGTFIEKATPVVQMAPTAGPLVMEMLKFGVTAFKVGKTVEGKFDELIDKMMQAAMNPQPPPPDPAVIKAQAEIEQTKKEGEITLAVKQQEAQLDERKMQREEQHDINKMQIEGQQQQQDAQFKQQDQARKEHEANSNFAMKQREMAAQHAQKMKMAQQPPARKQ